MAYQSVVFNDDSSPVPVKLVGNNNNTGEITASWPTCPEVCTRSIARVFTFLWSVGVRKSKVFSKTYIPGHNRRVFYSFSSKNHRKLLSVSLLPGYR